MSDQTTLTPETDAKEFRALIWPNEDNGMVVRSDLARTLERERDEWRKKAVELCAQRDAAISIGLDAVGQLIDLHHTTPRGERNVEWECRADLLDRNFRKLEDLPESKEKSCKPPNPA